MKVTQRPRWVNELPGWEQNEISRHLDPSENLLRSKFLDEPVPLSTARERRIQGEPLEYILGHCHVGGMTLEVNSSVLVPRPETETLLRKFTERLGELPPGPIVDCGTGCGLLAVGLDRVSERRIFATDVSESALEVARRNAKLNDARIHPILCDRLSALDGTLAGVVANLPYVLPDSDKLEESVEVYEPSEALFVPEGPEAFYGEFLDQALDRLHPKGRLMVELDQELLERVPIEALVEERNWSVQILRDNRDQPRFAEFLRPG